MSENFPVVAKTACRSGVRCQVAAVEGPDDGRERLVRIGPDKIDELRLAARLEREMQARYLPAGVFILQPSHFMIQRFLF